MRLEAVDSYRIFDSLFDGYKYYPGIAGIPSLILRLWSTPNGVFDHF